MKSFKDVTTANTIASFTNSMQLYSAAPNAYEIDDDLGKDSPRYTMPGRAKDPKAFKTPAPGAYDPKDDEDGPRYSFGLKPNLDKPNTVPGQYWLFFKIR